MKICLCLVMVLLSTVSQAADLVPYSASSIKRVAPGYVEVVGPGKYSIDLREYDYENTVFIAIRNIDSLASTDDSADPGGCILHYSSEEYSESISLISQSCAEALEVIAEARAE